jgi:hypothetical protein
VKLVDTLQDIQLLYVETPPIIYYVEANPSYIETIPSPKIEMQKKPRFQQDFEPL